MKRIRLLLPLALALLLAACGGNGPTPTPPTTPVDPPTIPVNPPITPPTTPPTVPPVTPPTTPPVTPTPPTTPPIDGQYTGDWLWVAVLPDDSMRSGYLTITETADIVSSFDGEQGAYLECEDNDCETALNNPARQGTGGIGTASFSDGKESLTTLFENDDGFLEVIAFDDNNKLGDELDNALTTFLGSGGIYSGPDDENGTDVVFALGKLSDDPVLPLSYKSLGLSQKDIDAVRAYQKTNDYKAVRQQLQALHR